MSENRISPEDALQLSSGTPVVVSYYDDGMRSCAGKVVKAEPTKGTLKLTIWPSKQASKTVTLMAAEGARVGTLYTMIDEDRRIYDLARPNEMEIISIELRNQGKPSSIQGGRKVQVESETIPGASTEVCDSCHKPVVIAIRIPEVGVFCNKCAKKDIKDLEKEKENQIMTSETGTATAPEKKTAKKGKAEAAPKKGKAEAAPKKKAAKGKAPKAAKKSKTKTTKRQGPSVASQILALMQRKGGATKAEMQKISPNSSSSTLLSLEKRGIKVKRTKNKDGYTVYSVKA